MEWLKETIKLSSLAHKNKVIADLNIKTEKDAARARSLECFIYVWEWQRENAKPAQLTILCFQKEYK